MTKIERDHSMNQISTIGLDLAKNVFQVHGIDARGKGIIRKPLRRGEVLKFFAGLPPCLIGIEACATALACNALHGLIDQMRTLAREIDKIEKTILTWHRKNTASRRLAAIPGIGPITASAITAAVPDATLFSSGRSFAAWLGLTPRAHSSGGKEKLVGISKRGDSYIRRLLVIGATAVIRRARQGNASKSWAAELLTRKPARLVSVALANKTARIAWALLARNQTYVAGAGAA